MQDDSLSGTTTRGRMARPLRILFLEDYPDDAILCQHQLEEAGYQVSADIVSTEEEVFACLASKCYDVLLSDYHLPQGNGAHAAAQLKAAGWDIPVILVTGYLGEEQAVECLHQGVADFVLKDRLARLPSAVRRVLEEKALREAEQRSREAAARLAAIVESSSDAIVSTNLQGVLVTWNTGASRLYGYAATEAVGRPMSLIIPADRLHEIPALAGKPERWQRVLQKETWRAHKDGQLIPVLVTVSPLRNEDGEIVGVSEIAHDITARRRMENQLRRYNRRLEVQNRRVRQADRAKSQFVANMSHELRTPLNCIIGFSEVLYDNKVGPLSDRQRECLADILTSSRHLLQLVNDVLDLARVEAGKLEFRPEQLCLEDLVDEVVHQLRPVAARKMIQIDTQVSSELAAVTIDSQRVKQILYNYISNALKFSREGGRVVVRAQPEQPDCFRLQVEDHGIGIRPEDIGELFGEFRQLDNGMSKRFEGTGLGLALTRRLVEASGGRVGVRSTPGCGSTFYAVLRRVFPEKLEIDLPQVLVIESASFDTDTLANLLAKAGCAVKITTTRAEAVAACRLRSFAAIVLPVAAEKAGGAELYDAIRAGGLNQLTPFIALHAGAGNEIHPDFPVAATLSTPVDPRRLFTTLWRAGIPIKRQSPGISGAAPGPQK